MSATDFSPLNVDIHPIDIVETLALDHAWDFDRIEENQIAMAIEGDWRTYSITLAWSDYDETLRLICSFEMEPPANKIAPLSEVLVLANDQCWSGGFHFWPQEKLMVYRYGLLLSGGAIAGSEQIDQMVEIAIENCEKYYPAFQLVCWSDNDPAKALGLVFSKAYGRA